MKVTIKFYKSSSKYYDPACKKSEYFENFTQVKSENTLILDESEIRDNLDKVREIIGYVTNWSKTVCFIDDSKVSFDKIHQLLSIMQCEKSCSSCLLGCSDHCYDEGGWGCKHLSSILLRNDSYYSYRSELCWYDFGHFADDTWHIDKNRILTVLRDEAQKKQLTLCQFYSEDRVNSTIQTLLDEIVVSDESEWEFKYRDAPMGMPQTEIIGVKPKEKKYGGFGISISLGDHDPNGESSADTSNNKDVPTTTFDDIGGIDNIVQQVREVIELPLIAPHLFEHYHIKPHKGVLLYGPPGCGKTLIAKAVANEINAHFITVNGPEILNKYVGQSETNLRNIFKEAQAKSPSVIYFDEFDSISATRDADGNPLMAGVVNQLLTLMDGMDTSSKVCCIASTNRIDIIDSAIKRPGRFDYVIEIERPSPEGCKAIFRIHTANMPIVPSFNRDLFVERNLLGCTGAEIAFVAAEAAYNSIRRTVNIKQLFANPEEYIISDDNTITEMDFIMAAKSLKKSRQRAETAKYRNNN